MQDRLFYYEMLAELVGDGNTPYDMDAAGELARLFWDAVEAERHPPLILTRRTSRKIEAA